MGQLDLVLDAHCLFVFLAVRTSQCLLSAESVRDELIFEAQATNVRDELIFEAQATNRLPSLLSS